jgi:Domain of unknown function (DUF4476)
MKKILVIAFLLCVAFEEVQAQSLVKVHLTDNSPLNVAIDGRYFNKTGTSVTVGDLPPGRHRITIYSVMPDRRGRGRESVVYEGKINTEYGMVTLFTYDPNSDQVTMDEQDVNTFNSSLPANGNVPAYDMSKPQQDPQQPNAYRRRGRLYGDDGGNDGNAAPVASPARIGSFNDAKMGDLKQKVDAENTDTKKTNVLKQGLEKETMTTYQVSQMMDWLEFEDSKVAFAEWAYDKVTDKDFYTDLENKLTYQNYRDELDQFIKSKH